MTKQDFFRVLIKVFGLYSLILSAFSAIPSAASYSFQDFGYSGILFVIFIVSVLALLFILLIFKSDFIIRLLRLDKGFDGDRFDISNIDATGIIKLSAIIIGGMLFIDNLPIFISHTYYAFKLSISGDNYDYRQNITWATSGLYIILGYLLVLNHHKIPRLIKEKKNNA